MRSSTGHKNSAAPWVALALVLTVLGFLHYCGAGLKVLPLLAGVGTIILLARRGGAKRLWNLPTLLLLGYTVFSWLTIFWAMSGKFHLNEGSKLLIALFFFLLIVLHRRFDGAFARRVTAILALIATICAFLGIEAASTGLFRALVSPIRASVSDMGFINRLYGIFCNSNIEASIYALGIFCALALLAGTQDKRERALSMAALAVNALAFLLAFSMGAIACFALAVLVYLVSAGKARGAVLVRMLEGSVPTLLCAFLASRCFSGGQRKLVFAILLLNLALCVALELTVGEKLCAALASRAKLTLGVIVGLLLAAAVFAVAALNMTGSYTFGSRIFRSVQLPAGEHSITVEADGEVSLYIYSRSRAQLMYDGSEVLYDGSEASVTFTVPEDSEIVFIRLSASGVTAQRVMIDGTTSLPLRYKLLPNFVAERLQQLPASNSAIQRATFREDAVKLFRLSPIVGNGVGAFETGVTRVQSVPYTTRYVHNHYLQVLLEDGVIGFALYLGALLSLLFSLWKSRRRIAESEFAPLHPALCAAFVMNCAQMLWDVSMSHVLFLPMAWAVYALIVGICADPLPCRESAAEAESAGKKKKKAAEKKPLAACDLVRYGALGFAAVITLSIFGNLYTVLRLKSPAESTEAFLNTLQRMTAFDLYEKNDIKLSYVLISLDEPTEDRIAQSNEYAAQLAKVQSNSLPMYLTQYYLATGQYASAIDEAILGATYSASNAEKWNGIVSLLSSALIDTGIQSPLLSDPSLIDHLADYRDALERYNTSAVLPVELNEDSRAFFTMVERLIACDGDPASIAVTLVT